MCEPAHSITQFPVEDDRGNPTGPIIDNIPRTEPTPKARDKTMSPSGAVLSQAWDWKQHQLGDWYHISRPGFGHSETIGFLSVRGREMLPAETRYETDWCKRVCHIDGPFRGRFQFEQKEALLRATQY